jgi:hypothetical protein
MASVIDPDNTERAPESARAWLEVVALACLFGAAPGGAGPTSTTERAAELRGRGTPDRPTSGRAASASD